MLSRPPKNKLKSITNHREIQTDIDDENKENTASISMVSTRNQAEKKTQIRKSMTKDMSHIEYTEPSNFMTTKRNSSKRPKPSTSNDQRKTSSSHRDCKDITLEEGTKKTKRDPLGKLPKGKSTFCFSKNTTRKEMELYQTEPMEIEYQYQLEKDTTPTNINTTYNIPTAFRLQDTLSSSTSSVNLQSNIRGSIEDNNSSKHNTTCSSSKYSTELSWSLNHQEVCLFNFDITSMSYKELFGINYNVQYPYEYLNQIYTNLLIEERTQEIVSHYGYMQNQSDINEQMRAILVDWLIDVHLKFKFTEPSLYMTINIIDRYLSLKFIQRARLQLLGVTALFISSKHEEIIMHSINEFVYVTDNAYKKKEILEMEFDILQLLNFSLLVPSPISFYDILSLALGFDKKQFFMGKYLMESFMLGNKVNKYTSSIISCAASYVIMKYFKLDKYQICYDKSIFNFKTIDSGVKDCAKDICCLVNHLDTKSNLTAAKKKYSSELYESASFLNLI